MNDPQIGFITNGIRAGFSYHPVKNILRKKNLYLYQNLANHLYKNIDQLYELFFVKHRWSIMNHVCQDFAKYCEPCLPGFCKVLWTIYAINISEVVHFHFYLELLLHVPDRRIIICHITAWAHNYYFFINLHLQ